MREGPRTARVAIVTGASGQDGSLLVERLIAEGSTVHAVVRDAARAPRPDAGAPGTLRVHVVDLVDVASLGELVANVHADEIYNLGGVSSVAASFADPWMTWETNARPVIALLQAIRDTSPRTRLYQASSSEMFGAVPSGSVVHDEDARIAPLSPYATAKAAALLACRDFRRAFGVRVACGISFNHESSRRPGGFLTRKVLDHVRHLRALPAAALAAEPPLVMGNLAARRDWGFAPDYVDGIVRVLRQVEVRAAVAGTPPEPDEAAAYRDYVLATGVTSAVWELVDRAFALAGLRLEWDRSGPAASWRARLEGTSHDAVVVDPGLLRPSDPAAISGDPGRARDELGWSPRTGLDTFLREMLDAPVEPGS